MKICIISETFLPQVNGIVRTLERLINFLEKQGHEILLITLGEGESEFSNTKIKRVPGISFNLYKELHIVKPENKFLSKILRKSTVFQLFFSYFQSLIPFESKAICNWVSNFKPDIIHLVSPATLGSAGYYAANTFNIPCIASFHTDISSYTSKYSVPFLKFSVDKLTEVVYKRMLKVLAPSPSSKNMLENLGLNNLGIFGRGADLELFNSRKKNRDVLEKYSLNKDKITLIYAGRLAEEKSIPELITAFKNIRRDYDIQLLIVGDGPIKNELEKSLENFNGYYAFTGLKKGEELAELYASADIFAFPSKTETFGQVVLEAMSSGLPVVAYDAPGVRDLVIEGETGFLAKDFSDFQFKIIEFIKDTNLIKTFSQNAIQEACKYNWDEIFKDLEKEYEIYSKSPR